jgi:hypothetical protein
MSRTLSNAQYNALVKKSKVGWAKYYTAEAEAHQQNMDLYHQIQQLKNQIKERDAPLYEKDHIPDFVKNEITELLKELKKNIECPICYEELKNDQIKFSSCGHKYCESCLSKINECAICRKKIYHK